MHTLRVFCTFVKYKFLAQMEYPGSYILGILAQWAVYGASVFMIYLMINSFGALGGWLPVEVIFLYAVWLMTYSLGAAFVFNICMGFSQMSIGGTLDEAYVRPLSPFAYLLATHFNLGYISHILLTTGVMVFSIIQLGLAWSFLLWLWFGLLLVSGAVITACLMLLCEMPAFRTRSQSPLGMFFWEGREFTQYPITIYPRPVQMIFTTILPFGFVSFYPIQVLLGKQDGILPHVTVWLAPFVAIVLVAVTAQCWRAISRGYESAGT
jgi:ABC-2 type transport system permease protein